MLLIMYGIIQVYRFYVRLATGPGGLKPIWILAPVAVRFSGRYKEDREERSSHSGKELGYGKEGCPNIFERRSLSDWKG